MIAAKAFFVVTAGVLSPEQPVPEHTKQWGYTSQDFEADMRRDANEKTLFAIRRDEALAYARDVIDPGAINWVRLEFVWI